MSGTVVDFVTERYDKPLASGDSMIIYIEDPDSVSINDISVIIGITVFTQRTHSTTLNATSIQPKGLKP